MLPFGESQRRETVCFGGGVPVRVQADGAEVVPDPRLHHLSDARGQGTPRLGLPRAPSQRSLQQGRFPSHEASSLREDWLAELRWVVCQLAASHRV